MAPVGAIGRSEAGGALHYNRSTDQEEGLSHTVKTDRKVQHAAETCSG